MLHFDLLCFFLLILSSVQSFVFVYVYFYFYFYTWRCLYVCVHGSLCSCVYFFHSLAPSPPLLKSRVSLVNLLTVFFLSYFYRVFNFHLFLWVIYCRVDDSTIITVSTRTVFVLLLAACLFLDVLLFCSQSDRLGSNRSKRTQLKRKHQNRFWISVFALPLSHSLSVFYSHFVFCTSLLSRLSFSSPFFDLSMCCASLSYNICTFV